MSPCLRCGYPPTSALDLLEHLKIERAIDELDYRSYRAQREYAPEIPPARWFLLYDDALLYEARYQAERATGRALAPLVLDLR